MDIATVRIGVGSERVDGVLEARPYSLDVSVEGYGLAEVRVTNPQGTELAMIELMAGFWWNEMAGYSSLDDLLSSASVGFGRWSASPRQAHGRSVRAASFDPLGSSDRMLHQLLESKGEEP